MINNNEKMPHDIHIVYSCFNCGHEIHIENDDELINYLNEDCNFCRDGKYLQLEVFIDRKIIFKKVV